MEKQKQGVTRRGFGKVLATAGAATAVPMTALGQARAGGSGGFGSRGPAPSDKIVFGGIGVRGRGLASLRPALADPRVQFVAVCDVHETGREVVKSLVDETYGNNDCQVYSDDQAILSRTDIDAFIIATSDRWHAPLAAWAAESGKDMYEEKPAAMSIDEAFALADSVDRYGVVYQSGCQRKNQFCFEYAVGLARSGKLGRLLEVHADTAIGLGTVDEGGHGWWPAEEDPNPQVFDWDTWLGPAMWRPYNAAYWSGGRGNFWDTHAGLLEWASHTVAMAQWAADKEDTMPIYYEPEGGDYRGDGLTGRYTIYCTYDNGVKLILRNHSWDLLGSCSNRFVGTDGWVETGDSAGIEVSDNLKHLLPTATTEERADPTAAHVQDLLHCIRSRSQPRANASKTAWTHAASHAASIAAQLNRPVTWDPVRRQFINDDEANRMIHRTYRAPWRMGMMSTSM